MAEVALTSVISKVVDVVSNLIVEESSRLYWLKEDMRWLKNHLRHMRAYQEVADAKQITNPQVAELITQIRELAHDVEDTLEDFLPKIESYRSHGFMRKAATLRSYYHTCSKLAREIEKIKKRVEGIDADRKTFGIPDIDVEGAERVLNVDPRVVALHVDDPVVLGLDKDIADLKNKLVSEEERLLSVAVVGMAGVGKTTLAKKVFKSVKEQFDCSALISISQQPNVKDILDNIAKQVGLAEEARKENLEANLYAFLQRKRYVLLLDDIWSEASWDSLVVGFPTTDCVNGSRIIITSRYMHVGRYICGGERSLHELKVLDFLTSWDLFTQLIMPTLMGDNQGFENQYLREIGEQIVKQCDGLPLGIVVTIGMLRAKGTSEDKWNEVLQNMRKDTDDKCSQILALSYKDLPSTLKPCFLYLGAFPEDYEVLVSNLVRLWMAENFIEDCKGCEPEDVGERYVNELVSRNLVQVVSRKHNGKINRIRIHDLLHSLCINTAREINFLHAPLDNQNPSSETKIHRLSAHQDNDKVFTSDEFISGIRALHVFNTRLENSRQNQNRLLCNQKLQVINIDGSCSLPVALKGGSSHPKYLKYPARVHLSKQNFKKLQTLDLIGVSHDTLVISNVIWKSKQLRHFISPDLEIERVFTCSGGDICLPNLQTLGWVYFFDVDFIQPGTFPNLRKFKVNIGGSDISDKLSGPVPISLKLETLLLWGDDPPLSVRRRLRVIAQSMRKRLNPLQLEETFNLSRYKNLTKLHISKIKLRQLPGLDHFPPNLLELKLYGNKLEEDPMQVLKKLPKLKILFFDEYSYDGRKLDCSGADSFPQLEVLHLEDLNKLEELTDGGVRGMHKLREFFTKRCYKFQSCPEWLQQMRKEK